MVKIMDKKESFKLFAKNHPELITSIKNGEGTWQKFYEIYDIYGEDPQAWSTYFPNNSSNIKTGITDIVKNIDMDSIQKHINTAQKALNLVSELTGKSTSSISPKTPLNPRPINKFFED